LHILPKRFTSSVRPIGSGVKIGIMFLSSIRKRGYGNGKTKAFTIENQSRVLEKQKKAIFYLNVRVASSVADWRAIYRMRF
jgi:hypothetical protein